MRVASPLRDVRDEEEDDVIEEPVRVGAVARRTRAVNESFRAAVDRSYTKRYAPTSRGNYHILAASLSECRARPGY